MSTPKLFFRVANDDDAFCYNLKHFKDEIIKENDEIYLMDAKISIGDGTFYCNEFHMVGLVNESECGSGCEKYDPRNGRSGRCRHSKNCYEPGDRKFTLTKNRSGKIKLIEWDSSIAWVMNQTKGN